LASPASGRAVWCVHPRALCHVSRKTMPCCCGILSAALACMCIALHCLRVWFVACLSVRACGVVLHACCGCLHCLHLLHSTCIPSPAIRRRHQYLGTASAVSYYLLRSCPLGGLNVLGVLMWVMGVGALLLLLRSPLNADVNLSGLWDAPCLLIEPGGWLPGLGLLLWPHCRSVAGSCWRCCACVWAALDIWAGLASLNDCLAAVVSWVCLQCAAL